MLFFIVGLLIGGSFGAMIMAIVFGGSMNEEDSDFIVFGGSMNEEDPDFI